MAEVERDVLGMAESVATMLRGASSAARTVTVKVKFSDLSLQTRSHTLGQAVATGAAIAQVSAALLASIDPGDGLPVLWGRPSVMRDGAGEEGRLSFDLVQGLDGGTRSRTHD